MARIIPNDLIKSMYGKLCGHSDIYFSCNRSSGEIHSAKLCNPYTGPATEKQTAQRTAFAQLAAKVAAWLNANKPTTTNLKGSADYQLAESVKKQLQLSSVTQVVYKYINKETGVVTLPSSDSSATSAGSSAGTNTGGTSSTDGGDDAGM